LLEEIPTTEDAENTEIVVAKPNLEGSAPCTPSPVGKLTKKDQGSFNPDREIQLQKTKTKFLVYSWKCVGYEMGMSFTKPTAKLSELSRREAQIMEVLYANGPSTVAGLTEKIPADLTRNAIRTFLTILTSKGVVTRTKQGREFIYSPSSEKAAAARSALGRLLDVFFNGSVSDAVAANFSSAKEQIDEDELVRLEKLIAEARRKKSQS